MSKSEKKLEMADVSYRRSNYDEAYRKYSEVIEEDLKNKRAWIGKGLSAARQSDLDESGFDECAVCLEKAQEIGLSSDDEEFIAEQIVQASREYIERVNKRVDDILSGGSTKLRDDAGEYVAGKMSDIANTYEAYNKHWKYYEKALDFSDESLKYDSSLEIRIELLGVIDFILRESEGNFHNDYLTELNRRRKEKVNQIREIDPEYKAGPSPQSAEDCFIATATEGSYDASPVIELRRFRDEKLYRSVAGRYFIQKYYRYSPPIARVIEKSKILRTVVHYAIVKPLSLISSKIR